MNVDRLPTQEKVVGSWCVELGIKQSIALLLQMPDFGQASEKPEQLACVGRWSVKKLER